MKNVCYLLALLAVLQFFSTKYEGDFCEKHFVREKCMLAPKLNSFIICYKPEIESISPN